MPGALACLRPILQSLYDFFSASAGTLLDPSDWAFFVLCWSYLLLGLFGLLVKEFYGTRYQSGFLSLNQCGEWFSLPA